MKLKKIIFGGLVLVSSLLVSGCSQDNMDNIEIIVTNYPNEYIVKELYDEHANITSIYPDGVDINNYKINKKQKNDFSNPESVLILRFISLLPYFLF